MTKSALPLPTRVLVVLSIVLHVAIGPALAAERVPAASTTPAPDESLVIVRRRDTESTIFVVGLDGRVRRFDVPDMQNREFGSLQTFDVTPYGKFVGLSEFIVRRDRREPGKLSPDTHDRLQFFHTTYLNDPMPALKGVQCIAVSPDGRKLAVHGLRRDPPAVWQLWCVDLATGKSNVFLEQNDAAVYTMRWSKGSDKLAAYAHVVEDATRDVRTGLYVIANPLAKASSMKMLAPHGYLGLGVPYKPTWADEDRVIYYTARYRDDGGRLGPFGLYRVRIDDGAPERVSNCVYHGSDATGRTVVCYGKRPQTVYVFSDHQKPATVFRKVDGEPLGGISHSGRYIGVVRKNQVKFWDLKLNKLIVTSSAFDIGVNASPKDSDISRDTRARAWWIRGWKEPAVAGDNDEK